MGTLRILLLGAVACSMALGISCQGTESSINQPPDTSTSTVDYFPLSVGNRWYYSRLNHPGIVHEIVRQYNNGDEVIYVMAIRRMGSTASDSQYLRKVNGDVFRLSSDGEDTIWFLNAPVGTSWNWAGSITSTMTNRDTVFRVPAGTFYNSLSILVRDPFGTVPYVTGLAPGIGLVARRNIDDTLALDSATIGNIRIP